MAVVINEKDDATIFRRHWKTEDLVYYRGQIINDGVHIVNPHGIGKSFYKNGHYVNQKYEQSLYYEGNWLHGKKEGYGRSYWPNGVIYYTGQWKNNKQHDPNGIFFHKDGQLKYQGNVVNGKYHGSGYMPLKGKRGYWLHGKLCESYYSGNGITHWPNGNIHYEGEWSYCLFNGLGILYDEGGKMIYKGEFRMGKKHNKGISYTDGKIIFDGIWTDDKENSITTLYFDDMQQTVKYIGHIVNGKYHIKGKLYRKDGTLEYDGEFDKGVKDGKGVLYYKDGKTISYDGTWFNNCRNGLGVSHYPNGNIHYEGCWISDNHRFNVMYLYPPQPASCILYHPHINKLVHKKCILSMDREIDSMSVYDVSGFKTFDFVKRLNKVGTGTIFYKNGDSCNGTVTLDQSREIQKSGDWIYIYKKSGRQDTHTYHQNIIKHTTPYNYKLFDINRLHNDALSHITKLLRLSEANKLKQVCKNLDTKITAILLLKLPLNEFV
jgi:antitoxin component YwqK of YwqJK toxin-antitoxin module